MNQNDIDQKLFNLAVAKLGAFAPVSDHEIEAFEKSVVPQSVPPHLQGSILAQKILAGQKLNVIPFRKNVPDSISSGLAMAARNGKEIPADILKKMRDDRQDNES